MGTLLEQNSTPLARRFHAFRTAVSSPYTAALSKLTPWHTKGTPYEDTSATAVAPGACHAGSRGAALPRASLCRAVSRGDGGSTRALRGPGRTDGLGASHTLLLPRRTAGVLRAGTQYHFCQTAITATANGDGPRTVLCHRLPRHGGRNNATPVNVRAEPVSKKQPPKP